MLGFHVFRTSLGWMGVAAERGRIVRVVLPEGSRGCVVQRIRQACPGAVAQCDALLGRAARQLAAYARGARTTFDLPLHLGAMTAFQRRVLRACKAIPFGACRTYGQLAAAAGSPGTARAVGQVMARNPLPILIPCHRVVGAAGQPPSGARRHRPHSEARRHRPASGARRYRLVGFSAAGGLGLKERLLAHEGVPVRGGRRVEVDGE